MLVNNDDLNFKTLKIDDLMRMNGMVSFSIIKQAKQIHLSINSENGLFHF